MFSVELTKFLCWFDASRTSICNADIILRKGKWPSISYRFAVESHWENRSATRVAGQRAEQAPLETRRVRDEENRDVEWPRQEQRQKWRGEETEIRVRERRDRGLSSSREEEYGVFYGFSQATLSFYFPLFKCQGRLTKTSRGATTLFPASAKHDASNEFLGEAVPSSSPTPSFSLVVVAVADVPFNDQ